MRTTRRAATMAAALVLALGGLLLTSAPAGAAGETEEGCMIEAVHEAEAGLEEGAEIEGDALHHLEDEIKACKQAPSPIVPEINEVIWGAFGFVIVFGFLAWKGLPAIKKTMNERTEKIRADIEGAETARAEAEQVKASYEAQLVDARSEANRIIEEARQDADAVRTERIAAIDGEIAEMRQRAATEIEASKAQALADLRGEITSIALGAAERVVERNLDDATNRALIDSYIDSVGAN